MTFLVRRKSFDYFSRKSQSISGERDEIGFKTEKAARLSSLAKIEKSNLLLQYPFNRSRGLIIDCETCTDSILQMLGTLGKQFFEQNNCALNRPVDGLPNFFSFVNFLLHISIPTGCVSNVTSQRGLLLVAYGADVNAKNNDGETPLDIAKKENNTLVAEFLSCLLNV